MPFSLDKATARVRPLRDPLTGREIVDPAEKPTPAPHVDTGVFALIEREELLAARLKERGRMADAQLRREFDKWAYNLDAHPVRRLRLQHPKGPLSRSDLAVLSGVSERTIARIEDHEGLAVGQLPYVALAAALKVRRDQVQTGFIA